MKHKNYTIGTQPLSGPMKQALASLVPSNGEQVIVHHYTDSRSSIQLEIERRGDVVSFERLILPKVS